MDRQRGRETVEVRAIIRRPPGAYLIVKAHDEEDSTWEFPGGTAHPRTPPEETLRRLIREQVAIELGVLHPQPAVTYRTGTRAVTCHYFAGEVAEDTATPLGYALLRWVTPHQLRDYAFAVPFQEIVDRIAAPGAPLP